MKHLGATLIGAMTLTTISLGALAATPQDEVRQEIVRFADLDLTQPAGAQELYRRIQRAARDVCEMYGAGGYAAAMQSRSCANQAIARAVADVGAPLVTARHEALTHRQIVQPEQARLNR